MSVDRSVHLHCDKPLPLCRRSFTYGTTNLRRTREAADAEGWLSGFAADDPDYCPEHKPTEQDHADGGL